MRSSVAALAAFACIGSAVAADSSTYQLRNGSDLVSICSIETSDANYANSMGFCHGVLTGAFRYYESTVTSANRFVCAPQPVPTRAKVMNDFVVWARAHPAVLKEPPLDALFRYLAEAYPCKG
jgi:hypothetical protein